MKVAGACDVISPGGGKLGSDSDRAAGVGIREDPAGRLGGTGAGNIGKLAQLPLPLLSITPVEYS